MIRTMNLHTAGHRRGVVCAPHAAAVEDGRAILAEGGNAIEAMLAMAASIAAVYPHMNHIGGDGFWLIREPSGRVRAIMGAGRAGAKATIAALSRCRPRRDSGARAARRAHRAGRGGGLDAGARGGQGARRQRHARSAAACAVCSRHQARARGLHGDAQPGAADGRKIRRAGRRAGLLQAFLVDGKAPEAGAKLKQTAFAATLEHLAQAGLDDFYRGDVGREIAADLERIGSPVTRADLEKYEARIAEPLSVPIGSRHALQHAAADARPGLADDPGAVRPPARRAGRKLRAHPRPGRGDQARLPRARPRRHRSRQDRRQSQPVSRRQHFSTPRRRRSIAKKAARWPAPYGEGDTVWMGAADASGLVVSYIQSLYWEFGSGCVLPATGVLMQNRGASFSLDPKALNALAPGRRPFHTLNPALAVLKDGRVIAYGTMGGDGQPQTPGRGVHPSRAHSASRSTRRSTRRAGCSGAPGARRTPTCGWNPASTAI